MWKMPFGELIVEVKDEKMAMVEAHIHLIEKEIESRFPVDGRLLIEVTLLPQEERELSFTCRFQPSLKITDSFVETGEFLELKSWYHDDFKWSIGAVDEDWFLWLRKADLRRVEYLENGISLKIGGLAKNKPFMLPFGVAWKTLKDPAEEGLHVVRGQPGSYVSAEMAGVIGMNLLY